MFRRGGRLFGEAGNGLRLVLVEEQEVVFAEVGDNAATGVVNHDGNHDRGLREAAQASEEQDEREDFVGTHALYCVTLPASRTGRGGDGVDIHVAEDARLVRGI